MLSKCYCSSIMDSRVVPLIYILQFVKVDLNYF